MTDHAAGSSHTVSSGETNTGANQRSVERALCIVEQYRRSDISKSSAIFDIQEALASSEDRESDRSVRDAFPTYLVMLDEAESEHRDARQPLRGNPQVEDEPTSSNRGLGHSLPGSGTRGTSSFQRDKILSSPEYSDEEGEPTRKRGRKSVDETRFPWRPSSVIQRAQLSPDRQEILALLDNWSNDPNFVVRKLQLSPGCPDFPPDQWTNIIKGRAVDLAKVLGAHYSTDIENIHSKEIQSHGEWVIAFGKTLQAISYALPQYYSEYLDYQAHISSLFAAVHPSHHDRVIKLDKAIRLKAANQKHLRLNDLACSIDSIALC